MADAKRGGRTPRRPIGGGSEFDEWDEPTSVDLPMHDVTLPGFGTDYVSTAKAEAPGKPRPAGIEITLVHERGTSYAGNLPWCAIEIWTRNRVYLVDSAMICIGVVNRAAGKPESAHPILGAKLTGGQRRSEGSMQISHPYPVPGTEAVFKYMDKKRGTYGQTSRVERMVLRVRVTTVSFNQAEPAWEQITSSVDLKKLR